MLYLLLTTVSILVFIQWIICSPLKWRGKGIKWLIPWPLFGNTFATCTSSFFDVWTNMYLMYEGNSVVGFHFMSIPTLLVRDPDIIKEIFMAEGNKFLNRGLFSTEKDPFTRNILLVKGEEWKVLRAKITPYLSPARVKGMFPLIEKSVDTLCQQMSQHSSEGPVDVDELSVRMSTDVTVSTIFGVQSDAFTNPDSFIFKLQNELMGILFGVRILVGMFSPSMYRALGLMTLSKHSTEGILSFVQKVFDQRIKGIGVRPDFMQGMVELYDQDCKTPVHEEYYSDGTRVARFNYKGIVTQCMTMFSASTETVGRNLGFLLYELAMNQDIQDRVRKEIFDIKEKNNGQLGYEQLQELKYTDMVLSESLRKYPPIIMITRKATENVQINDLFIEEGTLLCVIIAGIHRDPKYYPNPDNFDPERFAQGIKIECGSYIPFGLGLKGCAGIKMAQVEIKLAVGKILSKFKLTECSLTPKKITFCSGPTLRSTKGIFLTLNPL